MITQGGQFNTRMIVDRNAGVFFEFLARECKISVLDFLKTKKIDLFIPCGVANEFLKGECQLNLWSVPQTNGENETSSKTGGGVTPGTYSMSQSWSLTTQVADDSKGVSVQVVSATLPSSSTATGFDPLSPDQECLITAKDFMVKNIPYFVCSSDKKGVAKKCIAQGINHLWTADILSWMYYDKYINGWKASWAYRKVKKENPRLVLEKAKTFRSYFGARWADKKSLLHQMGFL